MPTASDKPLFSVITICRNAADVIDPTLNSVKSQTWTDFEYIVKDGLSTDSTLTHVAAANIAQCRIDSSADRGIYDAMNQALAQAQGEYILFLNAGDAFPQPDTLATYAAAIASARRPGIVYGQTLIVDSDRNILGPRHLTAPDHLTADSFKQGMTVCHQAMAVRRDIAPAYDTRYRLSADYDWAIRCLKASPANAYTGQVTALYLQQGATTAHRRRSLTERFRIMCRHYGTIPTIIRHIGFTLRAIRRRSL